MKVRVSSHPSGRVLRRMLLVAVAVCAAVAASAQPSLVFEGVLGDHALRTGVGDLSSAPAVDEKTNLAYFPPTPFEAWWYGSSILVFSAVTNGFENTLDLPTGNTIDSVAIDSSRRRIYVTTFNEIGRLMLWVVDADLYTVLDTIEIADCSEQWQLWWFPYFRLQNFITVNPNTGLVYVRSAADCAFKLYSPPMTGATVFNPNSTPTDPRRLERLPVVSSAMAVNPTTNYIYAIDPIIVGGTVLLSVIDGDPTRPTYNTVSTVRLAAVNNGEDLGFDGSMAVNRRTNRIYLQMSSDDSIRVIDGDPSSPTFHTEITTMWPVHGKSFIQMYYPDLWAWWLATGTSPEGYGWDNDYYRFYNWGPDGIAVNPVNGRVYALYATDPMYHYPQSLVVYVIDEASATQVEEVLLSNEENNYKARQSICVIPAARRIYVGQDHDYADYDVWAFREEATSTLATAAGTIGEAVVVEAPEAQLTFGGGVATGGETRIEALDPVTLAADLPGQFKLEGSLAYEISTSATLGAGSITVCLNASHIADEDTFASLALLHGEEGVWVDRTVSRDFKTGTICASVASLSPFAVVRYSTPPYSVQPLHDRTKTNTVGQTIPLRLEVRANDGVNVSSPALTVASVGLIHRPSATSLPNVGAGRANASGNFRFDETLGDGGGYVYNLTTKGLASGLYDLRIKIGTSPGYYTVPFEIK